jgi:hypothetical protein
VYIDSNSLVKHCQSAGHRSGALHYLTAGGSA